MVRIGIITCFNCTQDLDCASVVCMGDLRKRKGFFQEYPPDEQLELIGIINCAGCPTVNAHEKILRRVRSIAEFRVDAIHFSFVMREQVHHGGLHQKAPRQQALVGRREKCITLHLRTA